MPDCPDADTANAVPGWVPARVARSSDGLDRFPATVPHFDQHLPGWGRSVQSRRMMGHRLQDRDILARTARRATGGYPLFDFAFVASAPFVSQGDVGRPS